jgi:pimeloyl-[acyl-carrier protein] synthase
MSRGSFGDLDSDLDFDWTAPNQLGPEYLPRLQRIQAADPVFWSDSRQAWLITRHQDVQKGLTDARLSNHRLHLELERQLGPDLKASYPNYYRAICHWIFNIDGDSHTRLKRLMLRPFSSGSIEHMRPAAGQIIGRIIEQFSAAPTCDFYNDICLGFASATLLKCFGMDHVIDPARVYALSQSLHAPVTTVRPTLEILESAEAVCTEMNELFESQIALRRREPRDDLLTELVHAKDGHESLTEQEIVELFHVLLAGGFETTANTLALSVAALEQNPQQKRYFVAHMHDPAALVKMIEELGRFTAMTGSVMRRVAQEFEWHGRRVRCGDLVYLMICASNWDPAAFERPEILDLAAKRSKKSLTFGPGFHHCLGMFFAKMSIAAAMPAMYDAWAEVQVLEPLVYGPNFMARHCQRMPVRLHSRTHANGQ